MHVIAIRGASAADGRKTVGVQNLSIINDENVASDFCMVTFLLWKSLAIFIQFGMRRNDGFMYKCISLSNVDDYDIGVKGDDNKFYT